MQSAWTAVKKGIRLPVSPDCIAASRVQLTEVTCFFIVILSQFLFLINQWLRPYNCPRWDLAQKTKSFWAKSLGSTLVSRAYIRKVLTVEIYSQYARKNAWTGLRGIGRQWWRFYCLQPHTTILFTVTCYQWHSVEQLFWKWWTKRH